MSLVFFLSYVDFSSLFFCLFIVIILPFFLFFINRKEIFSLKDEIEKLQSKINKFDKKQEKKTTSKVFEKEELKLETTQKENSKNVDSPENISSPGFVQKLVAERKKASHVEEVIKEKTSAKKPKPKLKETSDSLEKQLGTKLTVWIGGVALIFAIFFLVKYAIENSILGPKVRISMGCIFGVILLFVADFIRKKPDFHNGIRISQALFGSGIAILYISVYAGTMMYNLCPHLLGFVCMAVITALAVGLSLRYGPPIAILGLIGGILTPTLIRESEPSAFLLFSKLFISHEI